MSENNQSVQSDDGNSDGPDTQGNTQEKVEVTAADLPLHCPMPGKRLWDSHPKVYLPIQNSGQERCPYCGTLFILKGPAGSHH